ncbi:TetR/AcrR family transcriptional regulator [Streptomyces sp. NPDC048297]|uniref:TetR/AcrR family transcriptional regulator n=1 Tax=Streptomyces sp. NPDC048297 TaxID=3365531 RepID=UPI00371982F1
MARTKNQSARREQLVSATMSAVSRHGLGRLRVSDVAEAAGVARGSVQYYFPDFDELLRQTCRQAMDRFFTARAAVAQQLDDARDRLVETAWHGLPHDPDDELTIALYEFSIASRDDSDMRLLFHSLYDRQVALYTGILEAGRAQGHFTLTESAFDIACNMVALEDAYGLMIISRQASIPPGRAFELLLAYAKAATGCPDLTADRRLPR